MDSGKDSPPPASDKLLAPGEFSPDQKKGITDLAQQRKDATSSNPSSEAKPSGGVTRRSFLKGLAAGLGLGFLGGAGAMKSTDRSPSAEAPTAPPTTVEPAEGVPQDDVYPMMQPTDGSALAQANNEVPTPVPDTVDGNNRAPGGGDVLPMTEDRSGNVLARAETGAAPERNPLPVEGSEEEGLPMMPKGPDADVVAQVNTGAGQERNPLPITNNDPEALPMMPKGPDADVVAQAQTGAGAERNPPLPPSENQTEPLPKMGPRDDDPVNA